MKFFSMIHASFSMLKRTRALWLAIIAPLFLVFFRTLILLFNVDIKTSNSAWDSFVEGNYLLWFGILFLLVAALDIALIVDIDRTAHSWKFIMTLPISRTSDVDILLSHTPQQQAYLGWSLPIILLISCIGTLCFTWLGVWNLNRCDIY